MKKSVAKGSGSRAPASFSLTPVKVPAGGTYLAELKPARKADGPPVTVRVIEDTAHTSAARTRDEESSRPQRFQLSSAGNCVGLGQAGGT
jgi:hypothetical protein